MPAQPLSFGPFSLAATPPGLSRGEQAIALRPRSLAVLRYLAERPGRLVSKRDLLDSIWAGRVVSQDGLRVCVREIRVALGDKPETPEYLETIAGKGYRFLQSSDGHAPLPETSAPMVGRESELQALDDYLRLARDGQRQFVLISGEPGIGKTTLLTHFLGPVAEQASARIIQAQCVIRSGQGEAFGPLLDALTRLAQVPDGARVVRALRRYAPMWLLQLPGLLEPNEADQLVRRIDGASPERMTRELCDAIEGLATETPVVLVLEDLHRADVATVNLLATLAQRSQPARLLLLGSYRPADAVLHASYLRDIVRDLRDRGQCQQQLLELLSPEDVASYLGGRLGGDVADTLAMEVFTRSNGNPLFMVELIDDLLQRHLLARQDGRWTASQQGHSLADAMPESLRALISRRLETLSDEQRLTLESASVAGLEFDAAAVAAGLAQSLDAVAGHCESLASRGLFINAAGVEHCRDGSACGRYRFAHPLYRDVLRGEIGEARRAQLQRRIDERRAIGNGERPAELTAPAISPPQQTAAAAVNQAGQTLTSNALAVLPFDNLSPTPDHAYFAAGMHEAILNELSKLKGLRVMARSAVLRYADGQTPTAQIGIDLNVQTVMQGSLQYADGQVRISAQLVDAGSGAHLWSEIYDREFKHIFAIETDIAGRIGGVLRAELTPREKAVLADKPTRSPEAYAAYLKAISVGALAGGLEITPKQNNAIHQSLDQALELDPRFALAYALKARNYAYSMGRLLHRSDPLSVTARGELAIENGQRALALDTGSGSGSGTGLAHAGLAVAHRFSYRDQQAQLAFQRAFALNPSDARILRDIAFFDLFRGRYDKAADVAREIIKVDPGMGNFLLGWALMPTGDIDGALGACRKLMSLRPDFSLAHQLHGFILSSNGDQAKALESLRLSEQLGYNASVYALAQTGFAYQLLGQREDALRIFDKIEALGQQYVVTDAAWALACLAVDDLEQALHSLSRSADQVSAGEDISVATITFNLFSAPVLEQPEFLSLRRRLGFVG